MGFEIVRSAIESRLDTNWGSTTDIAWENVRFEATQDEYWIRPTILEGEAEQITLESTPLYRTIGLLTIGVFAPEGEGTAQARTHADSLAAIFRGAKFSGLTFWTPTITRAGTGVTQTGANNGWFQLNVDTPFYYDEFI
jgi:hypothetical protein